MPKGLYWKCTRMVLRLMAVVGVLAGALTTLGCPGGQEAEGPVLVAASDASIPVDSTSAQALEGVTFTLPSGEAISSPAAGGCNPACPALATQPITVTFANTTSPTPNATLASGGNTATGTTTFGSCTFKVTSSNFPPGTGPQVGNTITVNPCQVSAKTEGVQVTGQATTVPISLQLGPTPSAAQQA